MSVYQIEEYYISLEFKKPLSDEEVIQINLILEDKDDLDWELLNDRKYLRVEGLESERDALREENKLINLLRGYIK